MDAVRRGVRCSSSSGRAEVRARRHTERLAAAGADVIAAPTRTPWHSLNARLAAPAGLQVTIFAELGEAST